LYDLVSDLPLPVIGGNQWFARGQFVRGELELLYKPEWGNKALLSYQQIGPNNLPVQIHRVLKAMDNVKNDLSS